MLSDKHHTLCCAASYNGIQELIFDTIPSHSDHTWRACLPCEFFMQHQMWTSSEAFFTHFRLVRLVSCVNYFMVHQVWVLSEAFFTHFTVLRLVSRMYPYMYPQLPRRFEPLPAFDFCTKVRSFCFEPECSVCPLSLRFNKHTHSEWKQQWR